MSRKNVLTPYQLVNNGDLSANYTSDSTTVTYTDNIGLQFAFTGTPEGDFFVQGTINGTDWQDLELDGSPAATGAAGGFLVNINQFPYNKIRVRYARSAGTGALNVWVMTKQVGG